MPNEGIGDLCEYILKRPIVGVLPWELVLWVNDFEPDVETVFADLVEASFPGYTRWSLDRDTWTVPIVADGCAESTYGEELLSFTNGGSESVTLYGYALYDPSSNVLRFVQRFDDDDIQPLDTFNVFRIL